MLQGVAEGSGTQDRNRGAGNGGVRGRTAARNEITRTRPLNLESKQGNISVFALYNTFQICVSFNH